TLALLLATPAADRRALLECTTGGGDRFVAAGCGATGSSGRLVGYAFSDEQPGTVALVRCATSDGDQYVAAGCAADDREVGTLGFAYPAED
ncbi:hypothetical protein, partial [Nocardioides stalactiti]|uniref:hypothetical protein n=1 Tax=Nocardioides stalactiti TaxID=2755356 RepID=UPI0016006FBA